MALTMLLNIIHSFRHERNGDDDDDFKLPDTVSLIIIIIINLLLQVRIILPAWDIGTDTHDVLHSYLFSLSFRHRTGMQNTWEERPLSLELSSASLQYLLDLL